MSTTNVVLVKLDEAVDGYALAELLSDLFDKLGNHGALSGGVTVMAGMNITEQPVMDALETFEGLIDDRIAAQEALPDNVLSFPAHESMQ